MNEQQPESSVEATSGVERRYPVGRDRSQAARLPRDRTGARRRRARPPARGRQEHRAPHRHDALREGLRAARPGDQVATGSAFAFTSSGELVASRSQLRDHALPLLESLRNQTGETVHLAVPEGGQMFYVERLESYHGLRFSSRVVAGAAHPSHELG